MSASGMSGAVLVRRWRNMLGRTMWDFAGEVAGDHRFLILGHGKPGMTAARDELRDEHRRYIAAGGFGDRLIACGPLLSDDGSEWAGTAMLAELPDRAYRLDGAHVFYTLGHARPDSVMAGTPDPHYRPVGTAGPRMWASRRCLSLGRPGHWAAPADRLRRVRPATLHVRRGAAPGSPIPSLPR